MLLDESQLFDMVLGVKTTSNELEMGMDFMQLTSPSSVGSSVISDDLYLHSPEQQTSSPESNEANSSYNQVIINNRQIQIFITRREEFYKLECKP